MTERAAIADFLAQRRIAVVGVSRRGNKFGNLAYRALKARGYTVVPVHPQAATVEGDRCAPSLEALGGQVDGALLVVPPEVSAVMVREAARAGIPRVWFQPGASSEAVVRLAEALGLRVVAGECIMMHAEPVRSFHALHRWFRKLFGARPS